MGGFFGAMGRGLVAGFVGTAAMTVAQTIEMRLRGRAPSLAPAKAVERVFGFHPATDRGETVLSDFTHFAYGTTWGAARGLLDVIGLDRVAAPVHAMIVQATAMTMLPALDLAPPAKEWPKADVANETMHHLVYSLATDATYRWLRRHAALGR